MEWRSRRCPPGQLGNEDTRRRSLLTQDPIGLAGGSNLYAYAGNDPVSYADPYGLCPEELRDKERKCPGGLTAGQYRRLQDGIGTIGDSLTRANLESKLVSGQLRVGTARQFAESPGSAIGSHASSGTILLNPDRSWEELGTGSLGFALGHEIGHKVHFDHLSPMQQGAFDSLVGTPAFFKSMERFADSVSCARGSQPGRAYVASCSPWRK